MGEVQEMTEVVDLSDLTIPELVAFVALLAPAYTRVSTGREAPVDLDELVYSVKSAMAEAPLEGLTDEELRAVGAVLQAAADARPVDTVNVIDFAHRRRAMKRRSQA